MRQVRRTPSIVFAAMLATALTASHAIGGPIQWRVEDGGNGHYYDLVYAPNITWHQARDAAAATTYLGSPGHLVTVTSALEDQFLRINFENQIGDPDPPPDRPIIVPGVFAWIGLTDEVVEGTYQWVTGEAFTFSNWGQGEPSGSPYPEQDYMIYWRRDYGSGPRWGWNDDFADPRAVGNHGYDAYLIEFGGPFIVAVPVPPAIIMGGIGIALVGLYRYRRRK